MSVPTAATTSTRASEKAPPSVPFHQSQADESASPTAVEVGHRIISTVGDRNLRLHGVTFGDIPWHILVHMYVEEAEGRPLSASDLVKSTDFSATTIQRMIHLLEQNDHLQRVPDRRDGRRFNLRLRPRAKEMIGRQLTRLGDAAEGA